MREVTPGHLLEGRVRHDQFRDGHRTGIEPVLLAASLPAKPGARVLEGGTGSGAALLCLAARVAGMTGVGIERDPELAELARRNVLANGRAAIEIVSADLPDGLSDLSGFDHAFANPPWHDPSGTASPDSGKEAAKRGRAGLLTSWTHALAASLATRGTLTLILPASSVPEGVSAMTEAGLGSAILFPLWPKAERPAKLVLLRAIKGGRAPFHLCAGLVLHRPDGTFTDAAQAVLREGQGLTIG